MTCNSSHSAPPCNDPLCWRRDLIATERDTLIWRDLRAMLIARILDGERGNKNELLAFLGEHWSAHAPRQFEIHELKHKMRKMEEKREEHVAMMMAMQEKVNKWRDRVEALDEAQKTTIHRKKDA